MSVTFRNGAAGDIATVAPTQARALARGRIDVYDDIVKAKEAWRQLKGTGACATPYQRYEWIALWHRHVGEPAGDKPLIVVGRDQQGVPQFLWPLVRRKYGPLGVAGFFGGDHSNLNAGIWRRDAGTLLAAEDIKNLLAEIARANGVDFFALLRQPARVNGMTNPFSLLAHHPSPDDVQTLHFVGRTGEQTLERSLSGGMRGKLRGKERKLRRAGGYRYARATNAEDVDRYLDTFFQQKAAHFAGRGIPNVFARPSTKAFLRTACHEGLSLGRPVIELHALEGGGEVIAVFGGVSDGTRLSCMFTSYTLGPNGRWSPGLILMSHMIANCADRRFATIDFGAGHARYKQFFCKSAENAFDTFLPVTPPGHVAAAICRAAQDVKRWVKSTPMLKERVDTLRGRRGG